jgi:lipopolysaccharide biosynthesis protein
MVGPEGHILALSDHFGANARSIDYLVSRTGIGTPDVEKDSFVSGSMFWVRLQALRPLLDAHLGDSEFEAEDGQIDGTLAHAVERIVSLCVRHSGMEIVSAGDICRAH